MANSSKKPQHLKVMRKCMETIFRTDIETILVGLSMMYLKDNYSINVTHAQLVVFLLKVLRHFLKSQFNFPET